MKLDQSEFNGKIINFGDLDETMKNAGFDIQWDYERVTYDFKIVDNVKEDVYYLRVPGHVHEGEIPKESAKVRMMEPYLGKHYYPHGVEYDEVFPERIIEKCIKKLDLIRNQVKEDSV
ncbi:YugN family protein [Alkalicoccus daliensis]|uniref:YugN-like family protein n=1 Tax=Alkalicoccus daliensis TaxID=745820 RepID=A0A1G9ZTX0_9BACI|nr:YugN family protein [Alkalicoccus daliensis]SDN24361.1 YugN-like family protein [Alkalicoccus daliensis]